MVPVRAAVLQPPRRRGVLESVLAIAASLVVLASLALIWGIRAVTLPRPMYVSEFGAEGEATALWFEAALLLLVAGAAVIAVVGRRLRSGVAVLRAWPPTVSLLAACVFFLVASQITCTAGCPLPVGATFTWQDFIHTLCAVLAFAAACWGMLQSSFVREHRLIARLSLVAAVSVAVVAGTGGILSLARFGTDVGSWLELIATTIAIAWLIVFGVVLAVRALREPDEATPGGLAAAAAALPELSVAQKLEEPVG